MSLINKYFRKHKCVKCILVTEDHKIHIDYLIPNVNNITFKDKTFTLEQSQNFFLDKKGYITYIFTSKLPAPIDPHNVQSSSISPELLNKGIDQNIATQILSGVKPKVELQLLLIMILLLIIAGFGLMYYIFNTELQTIKDQLAEIVGWS